MPEARTLIRGACILSVDPTVGDLDRGDILIEGARIAAVGPDLGPVDAEIVDAGAMIAIPGFVDTHRHTWQSCLRGLSVDWTHRHYYAGTRGVMGPLYRPEDVYAGNLLGICEALDSGITTLFDWSHNMNSPEHADAAYEGLRDSGSRAVLGYGSSNASWLPISDIPHPEDARRMRAEHFASNDGLVTMAMAIRGPEFTTWDVTVSDWQLARDLDLPISVHVGAGEFGRGRSVGLLHRHDMLGPDVTHIHCNTLSDEELVMICDTGGTTSVSPDVEMQMEMGYPATGRLMATGIRPSLSIDVPTAVAGNMFGLMRSALEVERLLVNEAAIARGELIEVPTITARDMLEFATLQGARACGLGDRVGSITPGKDADIVLIRTDDLAMTPLNYPVGQVVMYAHPGLVDTVYIAGRCVKRAGKLRSVDVDRVRRVATDSCDYLRKTAGIPVGEWIPDVYEVQNAEQAGAPASAE